MMHFTCDLCGKELQQGDDQRYVIKIEAFAADDPAELTEADLDADNMEAISQLLQEAAENPDDPALGVPDPTQHFRFDLCHECHKRFVRDPLSKEAAKFDFSNN